MGNAYSVGIIGGADGPTAIFVTSSQPSWLLPALVIVLGIGAYLLLRNK